MHLYPLQIRFAARKRAGKAMRDSTVDNRIVIGGGDADSADAERRDRLIPQKTRQLQRKLEALFPHT